MPHLVSSCCRAQKLREPKAAPGPVPGEAALQLVDVMQKQVDNLKEKVVAQERSRDALKKVLAIHCWQAMSYLLHQGRNALLCRSWRSGQACSRCQARYSSNWWAAMLCSRQGQLQGVLARPRCGQTHSRRAAVSWRSRLRP